jgi:hypothetical protein
LGAARTMRSITSPSTRRSRASSLRGGGRRGKASGEVSVCRGVPCTVRRVNLIFPASRARPRRDDPRESRRGVVRGDRDRTSRARGALRGAPACRTPSSCAPNTARGTTTQYAQVTPLNTREKQVAQANSLKPTRRQSLWASISPPRRGFPRSNGAVVESSDDRGGVALPAPWTWATEASGSTRRVRRRVTRVGRR